MAEDLKKELKATKSELIKTKSDIKLIEDKLDYCQERLLDIRNEKDNLEKKINDYEFLDIDTKLKEAAILKNDFLKQKHRLEVTKEFLDESRKEVTLLKEIIGDFKTLSNLDFIRKKYPESLNRYYIKYEEYSNYDNYKDKL